MLDLPAGILPSRGFSSQSNWSEKKWLAERPKRPGTTLHTASTMLAVTGQPGKPPFEQALVQLERSAPADGSMPKGSFYFRQTR